MILAEGIEKPRHQRPCRLVPHRRKRRGPAEDVIGSAHLGSRRRRICLCTTRLQKAKYCGLARSRIASAPAGHPNFCECDMLTDAGRCEQSIHLRSHNNERRIGVQPLCSQSAVRAKDGVLMRTTQSVESHRQSTFTECRKNWGRIMSAAFCETLRRLLNTL